MLSAINNAYFEYLQPDNRVCEVLKVLENKPVHLWRTRQVSSLQKPSYCRDGIHAIRCEQKLARHYKYHTLQ